MEATQRQGPSGQKTVYGSNRAIYFCNTDPSTDPYESADVSNAIVPACLSAHYIDPDQVMHEDDELSTVSQEPYQTINLVHLEEDPCDVMSNEWMD